MAQINTSLEERLNTLASYLNECKSVDSYPTLLEQDIDDILHCISFTLQGCSNKQQQSFEEVIEEAANSVTLYDVRRNGTIIHLCTFTAGDDTVEQKVILHRHSLYKVVDRYMDKYPSGPKENIEFVKID